MTRVDRPGAADPPGPFDRHRLRLARELRALSQTQLATRVGNLTAAAVSQFESGAARPALATMDRLAAELDVPTEFLCRPVDTTTHEGFFRSLRRTSVTDRRRARALGFLARDLADALGDHVDVPVLELPRHPVLDLSAEQKSIEDLADVVRKEWSIEKGPIPNVVDVLESHGIIVVRLPLSSLDLDAFSLPFPDHPVVVLASDKDDKPRSRFDAAHELGHLVLHDDQIWGVKPVEDQAHWFAAAFLMPRKQIEIELPARVDWARLFDLKRRWQVSLAALLMRMKTLERITPDQYVAAIKAASARGWRRTEPISLGRPEQPCLLTHAIADLGARGITLPDLVGEAGLPLSDVEDLIASSSV